MKVGILTLHAQTNYGGVLQAYALQETLKGLGHDAVIIDRWMDECNCALRGIASSRSLVGWLKFIGRAVLGFGDFTDYIRHVRTARMLPSLLNLTPYSFYHWKDAPRELGLDAIVVGSDQVWNPAIQGKELPYLLGGSPDVPAIAYAASFGTPQLPDCLADGYREGLMRFRAIGVREKEAVRIVESFGYPAVHVVDPTLLADLPVWNRFITPPRSRLKRKLFCYFINFPLGFVISNLRKFAQMENCDVEVFFGGPCALLPSSFLDLLRISSGNIRALLSPGVHVHMTATPDEFVREVSSADMVLTDSFHALMFATIFRKDIRVLLPNGERGAAGFARLREFCDTYLSGSIMCDGLPAALHSFGTDATISYNEEALALKIKSSMAWLKNSLCELQGAKR